MSTQLLSYPALASIAVPRRTPKTQCVLYYTVTVRVTTVHISLITKGFDEIRGFQDTQCSDPHEIATSDYRYFPESWFHTRNGNLSSVWESLEHIFMLLLVLVTGAHFWFHARNRFFQSICESLKRNFMFCLVLVGYCLLWRLLVITKVTKINCNQRFLRVLMKSMDFKILDVVIITRSRLQTGAHLVSHQK